MATCNEDMYNEVMFCVSKLAKDKSVALWDLVAVFDGLIDDIQDVRNELEKQRIFEELLDA